MPRQQSIARCSLARRLIARDRIINSPSRSQHGNNPDLSDGPRMKTMNHGDDESLHLGDIEIHPYQNPITDHLTVSYYRIPTVLPTLATHTNNLQNPKPEHKTRVHHLRPALATPTVSPQGDPCAATPRVFSSKGEFRPKYESDIEIKVIHVLVVVEWNVSTQNEE